MQEVAPFLFQSGGINLVGGGGDRHHNLSSRALFLAKVHLFFLIQLRSFCPSKFDCKIKMCIPTLIETFFVSAREHHAEE